MNCMYQAGFTLMVFLKLRLFYIVSIGRFRTLGHEAAMPVQAQAGRKALAAYG
jgi:hypothetical protein